MNESSLLLLTDAHDQLISLIITIDATDIQGGEDELKRLKPEVERLKKQAEDGGDQRTLPTHSFF